MVITNSGVAMDAMSTIFNGVHKQSVRITSVGLTTAFGVGPT